MRIGLYTPKTKADRTTLKTTDVTHAEVGSLAELSKALHDKGAKNVGMFYRDRAGAGHLEGSMMPAAELKDEHMTWLGDKPAEYQVRGVYYTVD